MQRRIYFLHVQQNFTGGAGCFSLCTVPLSKITVSSQSEVLVKWEKYTKQYSKFYCTKSKQIWLVLCFNSKCNVRVYFLSPNRNFIFIHSCVHACVLVSSCQRHLSIDIWPVVCTCMSLLYVYALCMQMYIQWYLGIQIYFIPEGCLGADTEWICSHK